MKRRPRAAAVPLVWTLALLASCSRSHEGQGAAERRDAGAPNDAHDAADALLGDWRWDYVTAGLQASHGRLLFEPEGRLRFEISASSAESGSHSTCAGGDYEVADGVVHYRWWIDEGGEAEREQTLAVLPAATFERERGALREGARRYWPLTALLRSDASGQRFTRIRNERARTATGVEVDQRARIEIEFSTPPAKARPGGDCELAIEVDAEITITQARPAGAEPSAADEPIAASAAFELPCEVRDRDAHTREVVVSGWVADDEAGLEQVPLHEAPAYTVPRAWTDYLEESGYAERWDPRLLPALQRAFSPDLLLDRAHPDVLFPRYIDSNAISADLYTQVDAGTTGSAQIDCE